MPLTAKVPSVVLYERPVMGRTNRAAKTDTVIGLDRFEVVFSQFEDAWEGEDGGINLLAGRGHPAAGSVHFIPKEHAQKVRDALGDAVKRERPKRAAPAREEKTESPPDKPAE